MTHIMIVTIIIAYYSIINGSNNHMINTNNAHSNNSNYIPDAAPDAAGRQRTNIDYIE